MTAIGDAFWAGLPLGRGVTLLAHDANGLAAFGKPAGVLSHPNEPRDQPRSLLDARYTLDGEYFEWSVAVPDHAAKPTSEAGAGGANPPGEPRSSAAAGRANRPGEPRVGGVPSPRMPGREVAEPRSNPQRLWLLNRLDSATSGVILAAADRELAAEIRAQFKRKQVRKVYQALVFGAPRQAADLWRDRLAVDKRGGVIRTAASAGNIPAECRMTVVRAGRSEPRLALLQLEPRTGRSHQLRVQCAKRNLPIAGDQTYGDFKRNREFAKLAGTKRLFLHSLETTFEYEWRGRRYSFVARDPLPPEFTEFLR